MKMAASTPAVPPFVVRIVSIDYYLARPAPKVDFSYAPLEGTAIDQVPVVRIFGSTPSGQKACVHLHKVTCDLLQQISNSQGVTLNTITICQLVQAFPYFYVPYDDSFPDEPAEGAVCMLTASTAVKLCREEVLTMNRRHIYVTKPQTMVDYLQLRDSCGNLHSP